MWYRLYLPDNYDPTVAYPLTTSLHGAFGNNVRPVVNPELDVAKATPSLVNTLATSPYESILIAPQLESGNWRSDENDRLIREAIADVEATFGTDAGRRYLTGLSFGGFGTFHMLQEFPGYFAAGVPLAGSYDLVGRATEYADRVRDTPIWAYHGARDNVVGAENSRGIVKSLRANNVDVRYTELPDSRHEIWDQLYDADKFPATVVMQLKVDSQAKTFQVLADVDQESSPGLHSFSFSLVGADTVENLAPKSDFSPETGTALGFTRNRSDADVFPVAALQAHYTLNPSVVDGFGQTAGALAGAGTGTGEVQAIYDAPLLLAEGTFSDLATLDFAEDVAAPSRPAASAKVIGSGGAFFSAAVYTELIHDDQIIYSRGDHDELFPWLFRQRVVPEPNSAMLCLIGMLPLVFRRFDHANSN